MEARSRFTAGVKITRKKRKGASKRRPSLHLGRSRPDLMEVWARVRDGDRKVLGELQGIRNVAKRMAPAEGAGMDYMVDWARNILSGLSEWGPLPKEDKNGPSTKAEDPETSGRIQDYRLAPSGLFGKEVPPEDPEGEPFDEAPRD